MLHMQGLPPLPPLVRSNSPSRGVVAVRWSQSVDESSAEPTSYFVIEVVLMYGKIYTVEVPCCRPLDSMEEGNQEAQDEEVDSLQYIYEEGQFKGDLK